MRQSVLKQVAGGIAIGLLLSYQPDVSIAGSMNSEKAPTAKTETSAPVQANPKPEPANVRKPNATGEEKPIARYWRRIMEAVREVQQAQSTTEVK
ncbi:hypothetical protein BN8_00441 [Fibrisoma limi BUZ 3]|uniref:Uncharacterized protein n=1 Tax=Fibrisoma limi BUZ 3 TaxID=1185876 RepID=I2GC89_9BACT|nr:hypothetical protein [Fibrisoma limi]CCH51513.1 hypothetical protein BN8_00441 [Fibrisoma limi BUZ 3]